MLTPDITQTVIYDGSNIAPPPPSLNDIYRACAWHKLTNCPMTGTGWKENRSLRGHEEKGVCWAKGEYQKSTNKCKRCPLCNHQFLDNALRKDHIKKFHTNAAMVNTTHTHTQKLCCSDFYLN